jgi:putative toxin-antitoxin system antitoxin component (TIGR02293 family)
MSELGGIGGGRPRPTRGAKVGTPKKATKAKVKIRLAKLDRQLFKPHQTATLGTRKRPIAGKRYVVTSTGGGVDGFVRVVLSATPLQLVEIERRGVAGQLVKDLAKRLDIPAVRLFDMLRVPKATVEKKSSTGEMVSGSGGHAAVAMAKLLGIAQDMVANSTAKEAKRVDAGKWLGQWLERPQPSLGGRTPGALLDTPTGVAVVSRLLGAIESGAYQ